MHYRFTLHHEGTGYWAEAVDLAGCLTQGDTTEELYANCEEALNLYLDEPEGSSVVFPLPSTGKVEGDTFEVRVEPEIAFSVLLRACRARHGITQKEAAARLRMKRIYGYQRYERRSNPSLSTIAAILKLFPDFPIQDVF